MTILTFDIEEWFHILDNDSTKTEKEWSNYECRIHKNVDRILDVLLKHNVKATFFCLGWIAEKYPEVIRKIDGHGFEIACHSSRHQLIYEQTKEQFKEDIYTSISQIENIIGKKVLTYRAPGFSLIEDCKWAFGILASLGIQYDSSIFPASRLHGGFPSYPECRPSIIDYKGIQIKEFPINTTQILGKHFVFSGGGYFRLFPYQLIKHWTKNSKYVMTYLHPRDFDPEQPMITGLPFSRRFKSYVGLKGSMNKFESWINDFDFIDIRTAIQEIDWGKVPVVKLERL